MNSLQAAAFPFANSGLTKAWSIPKFPFLNIEALLELHRRNAAALIEANRVVFDGLKTLAQRERALVTSTADDCAKVTKDVLAGKSVEERTTKQVHGLGHVYTSTVAGFLELSDMAVKTNTSAVEILNARVIEGFDELRTLFAGREVSTAATSAGPSIPAEPIAIVEEAALIGNAVSAVPSIATRVSRSEPRTARTAKGASKTSARASKAASKKTRGDKSARRRTSRR